VRKLQTGRILWISLSGVEVYLLLIPEIRSLHIAVVLLQQSISIILLCNEFFTMGIIIVRLLIKNLIDTYEIRIIVIRNG